MASGGVRLYDVVIVYCGNKKIEQGKAREHYGEFRRYVDFASGKKRTLRGAFTFTFRTAQFFAIGLVKRAHKMGGSASGGFNVNQAAASGLQGSMQGTQAAMGYQPMQVRATDYSAAQMGPAGQVAGADLSAYTNPYESQVVQQSLTDLGGAQEKALNQMGAQATAARAFGGSRQGIAEAETRKSYADQAARMVSGLRQSGYQQAQQLAGQDIARQMQADAANQAALNAQRMFGASQGMTAQQLNQGAGLQGAQFRLGAAGQMGNLGQQAFGHVSGYSAATDAAGLDAAGHCSKQLIDAARGQYAGYTGAPQQSLDCHLPRLALRSKAGASTTTKSASPGLFSYLQIPGLF